MASRDVHYEKTDHFSEECESGARVVTGAIVDDRFTPYAWSES